MPAAKSEASLAIPLPPDPLWVACLCAAWCKTCMEYRAAFDDLARAHPQVLFAWVDVEDYADALDDAGVPDVENFPTLALGRGAQAEFFGTVLPHAAVLERLLRDLGSGAGSARVSALSASTTQALGRLVQSVAAEAHRASAG